MYASVHCGRYARIQSVRGRDTDWKRSDSNGTGINRNPCNARRGQRTTAAGHRLRIKYSSRVICQHNFYTPLSLRHLPRYDFPEAFENRNTESIRFFLFFFFFITLIVFLVRIPICHEGGYTSIKKNQKI
jgi:hypothetical protein